jgi:hypothetical protein
MPAMTTPLCRAVLVALIASLPLASRADDDFERAPIRYSAATPDNAVSRLERRLDAGQARLVYEDGFGYLRSVLRELNVPASSQMLVFSKTSLQRQCIEPRTPRAVYFRDDVYVGFCRNGEVMEVAAADPQLGTVFYTVQQRAQERPRFTRQTDSCLLCHGGSQTRGVPGLLVRSVYPDGAGLPILSSGSYRTDHTSPLAHRWGGWYVTGTHGSQTHLGNLIIRARQVREPVDNAAGQNVTDLGDRIDKSDYLTSHSDIVALMVLEHQAEGHNLLTRANFQTRLALHQEAALNRELHEAPDHRWAGTTARIKGVGEPLVRYLLFCEEAGLTAPVKGTSGFAEEFAQKGPKDHQGRSLRDLDLNRRLFKYPCSYLIYSPCFDALPGPVKDYVYGRLHDVLTGRDQSKDFAHLSAADRRAILEVLLDTRSDLPGSWRAAR